MSATAMWQAAEDLCSDYTRDGLRTICRIQGVRSGWDTKMDLAIELVLHGFRS